MIILEKTKSSTKYKNLSHLPLNNKKKSLKESYRLFLQRGRAKKLEIVRMRVCQKPPVS
jgi:hypothetical protein